MKAFEGYRVLDLTHVLAGPFCTYQLAVLGAEVIKIEAPGDPDMVRAEGASEALNRQGMGTMFQSQGANKRALSLNLKCEAGRAIFRRLVAGADVVVENYRAGAFPSLGLGYEDLASLNPSLVYCSITGFGQTGPKAGHTAFDNVIQARSGLMATTGTVDTAPVRVGAPVLDYGTGAQAAFAIAAALLRRERTGKGQRLDVSMLDAALVLMASAVVTSEVSGEPPVPHGNSHPKRYAYGCHSTADGLLMLGVHTARQHERLWRALGRDDLAEEARGLGPRDIEARCERHRPILQALLLTRPAREWEALLVEAGLPASRVRALDETLADPQLDGRAVLQRAHRFAGFRPGARVAVSATTWAEDGPEVTSPPPAHGEHTEAILGELGFSADEVTSLRERGVV